MSVRSGTAEAAPSATVPQLSSPRSPAVPRLPSAQSVPTAPSAQSMPVRLRWLPARMPPVPPTEFFSPGVRAALRRERAERSTRYRSHWWFPLFALLIALSGCWGLLKADQLLADDLIWPSRGAQFVEVGPLPPDPAAIGGRMMIVVGGLNRKSGTGTAAALMPSLTVGHTRVFSLIYGSGISDQDLAAKFDALMGQFQPREVSFFGSSMGGDVVLNLAAHAQQRRADYQQSLLAGPVGSPADVGSPRTGSSTTGSSTTGAAAAQRDRVVGGQAGRVVSLLVTPDSRASTRLGTAGAAALTGAGRSAGQGDGSRAGGSVTAAPVVPPRLGTIFLDCSPLGADDVRDAGRTQADALTAVTEALHTDGGVAVRLTAEVLAQQQQWSTGWFPFLQIRPADLIFKINQVWREKISTPGISTQLIKDQYGVIRRMDIDDVAGALGPGTRIVYFLPENRDDDPTVLVGQVESTLRRLASDDRLDLRVVEIPGGGHASAETNADAYRGAIDAITGGGT
ncbi:MAG TPA: hypothetical protein VII33_19490 [Nakamurella sp.]